MEGNNPLLIGHPGGGQSTLVKRFALALIKGAVPPFFRDRAPYVLSLSNLIAGTKYRGEMEARLEGLLAEVLANKNELISLSTKFTGYWMLGWRKEGSVERLGPDEALQAHHRKRTD